MGALLLALKVYTFYGPKYANANIPHIHRVESRITGVVMVPWRNAPTIYVGAVFNGTRHAGGTRGRVVTFQRPCQPLRKKSPSCLMSYLQLKWIHSSTVLEH